MRKPQRLPSPRATGNWSSSQAVLMTTSFTPAVAKAKRCHSIRGLPCTGSKGLGVVSVRGRMRSPRPAARIRARGAKGGAIWGMPAVYGEAGQTVPMASGWRHP